MLEGLQAILEKEVVLSTVNPDDLLRTPQRVEDVYRRHVAAFIPMGEVDALGKRFAREIEQAHTPKGMIVAPYGYGKTSTLAFLWAECESQGVVAVPPFYCATLLDILKATYGWVKYRLETTQPELIANLDEVYRKYSVSSIEQMAAHYAEEHGIAQVTAIGLLRDMLKDGTLVLEITPSHLLFFLDATVALVVRGGFRGLAILLDEFQQYINKSANLKRTIQEFREFVWGLDTRATPLGVLISLPTYAESVIQEQGKDILHRLKADNFYYRLQDIYTREFPLRLWERYTATFRLGPAGRAIIDDYALQALGQIAEREDLGEGPRTVIDTFKRAIACYQDRGRSYNPVDLIDDFLQGNIRFQAQANKIRTVTRQALGSAAVDTPEKIRAIKLMAAFPRGCPVEVQKRYGVYEAVNALSRQVHGELMTHLSEGYTLLGLRPSEGPTRIVDIVITQFWREYEEDELHLESAIRAFAHRVLPVAFQRRRGAAAVGWGEMNFTTSSSGSYSALVEGTFTPRFPHRSLGLQIAYEEKRLQPLARGADMQFDFLFDLAGPEDPGELLFPSDGVIRFRLNLQQRFGPAMPDDIRKLQDFVNPEFVTPLLMLSLIDYFDRWEETQEQAVPESDRAEIEYLIGRLVGHISQMLFNRSLAQSAVPPLHRVGNLLLEELFNRRCGELWPHYRTLYVSAQYESVLNDYINAMRDMPLKQRRGHAPLRDAKSTLARRFGLGSVATFENRVREQYADLMRIVEWKGRGDEDTAEIVLQLHPLESAILDRLRNSPTRRPVGGQEMPVLFANEVEELARPLGYREEEMLLALQLLAARGYIRFDTQDKLVYLVQVGSELTDLRARLKRLLADLATIPPDLLDTRRFAVFRATLEEIRLRLELELEDEEELDELKTRLADLERDLDAALAERRASLRGQLNSLALEIERDLIVLRQSDILDREIQGQLGFVQHLNELRQDLTKVRRQLATEYAALKKSMNEVLSLTGEGPIAEAVALHRALCESGERRSNLEQWREQLQGKIAHLERWVGLLQDADRLFTALQRVPDLRDQLTRQVVPEIQAHLTKRKQEGLGDWEPFKAKVAAIEEELGKRRRHGNEQFGQAKERYESFLREIEVGDYRPRTRYTYGEDEESYRDLYEEVRAKIEGRLDEIAADLERDKTDLLKARYIYMLNEANRAIVTECERQIAAAEKELTTLRRAITLSLVQQGGNELATVGQQVKQLATLSRDIREKVGPVLYADHRLTEAESRVLAAFGKRRDIDLTDLFVELRRAGQEIELGDLLKLLEALYRKNRVIIQVRQRG